MRALSIAAVFLHIFHLLGHLYQPLSLFAELCQDSGVCPSGKMQFDPKFVCSFCLIICVAFPTSHSKMKEQSKVRWLPTVPFFSLKTILLIPAKKVFSFLLELTQEEEWSCNYGDLEQSLFRAWLASAFSCDLGYIPYLMTILLAGNQDQQRYCGLKGQVLKSSEWFCFSHLSYGGWVLQHLWKWSPVAEIWHEERHPARQAPRINRGFRKSWPKPMSSCEVL